MTLTTGQTARLRHLLLYCALVGLAIGGCNARGPGPTDTAPGTPTASPTPDPRTLVWGIERAPSTLDAARIAIDAAGTEVAAQIYDRLVRYRPGTTQLAPGIAEDWDAEVDGRSFTFTLREGLSFHDGTPLDARAVVWNFNRWMVPEHPAHRPDFIAWQSLLEAGNTEEGRPTGLVDRVEAIDARTVRITLNAPFAPFLHVLALVPFGIASPRAVEAQGDAYGSDGGHLPVGSGPFKARRWTEEGQVELEPFDGYWAGRPEAPGVRFVPVEDAADRAAAVAEGRLHGADLPASFDVSTVELSGGDYVPRPSRATAWLMVNHSRPPLGDTRVRQAISLAIDRSALAESHFGAFALPAGQILPPEFLGHNASIEPQPHDPERARQLLAEAGSPSFSLIIWTANESRPHLPDPTGAADAVAAMLRDVGIDASVRTESLRPFLADRDRGRFSAWIIGWEAQTADPDNFWFFHFWSSRVPSEGQYENPVLASRLLDAQRTLAADERVVMYEQSAADVNADTARIFLAHTRPIVALSDRVDGFEAGPMGFDSFADVSLRPERSRPSGTRVSTQGAGTPSGAQASTPGAGTPSGVVTTPDGGASSGTPESTQGAGTPSTGGPSAGTPSAGTPSAGTPSAGTPSAGTPSAGTMDSAGNATPEATEQ